MMKKYLLPAISVALFALVLLVPLERDSFRLRSADVLDRIAKQDFLLDSAKMKTMLKEGAVLVDLNGTQEFKDPHLSGSVNLPLETWDVKTIRSFFKPSGKYILCSEDLSLSCMAWMLLTQMGMKDVWVLGTGKAIAAGIDHPTFSFKPVQMSGR